DAARRWYLAAAEGEPSGIRRGELWLAAAGQAERAGDPAEADRLRVRAVTREPAAAAHLVLDPAIRARMRRPALDAARALLAAGRAPDAEPFATAAMESGAAQGDRVKDAHVLRAEIRAVLGDRAGAEADYAAFLARWPADPRTAEIVYDRARLALRFQDGAAARSRLQNFLARFPGDRRASAALYLIADSYQDDRGLDPGHADRAIEVFDRVAREHPGSTFADRAYMRAAHLSFALGRVAEAERRYAAYRGSQSAREARYWRARALERRGDGAAARGTLSGLAAGDDYYALLSRDRLRGRPGAVVLDPGTGGPGPASPYRGAGAEVLADPAGRTAAALLAFGEREYAGAELERAASRLGGDRARLEAWAIALAGWGFPGVTLQIGVRLGGERHPLAYPVGFATAVDLEARAHGLDPWYVLALIRQESLYDADVVSPADARGLMQILPATGREIADSLGWGEFDERDLFDPAVNLHFGARYLEDQLARFDGFWPAVLAAYNGGPHVVALWWDFPERTQDPELWVERIPYRETRDYVKKIAAQRARYRSLHAPSAASR
ncbi:MAG TPA: transglycosylase SLT domain-containing protein, partial [Gemmatimonadota bacterium]|nr:transglycosylase SLT domain-containing protein [Gemmatimonadota bacterium]